MKAEELRKKFIEFFVERGHKEIPAASLIPENDPSTLFTTAGMQALVPFLAGREMPPAQRLTNIQDCMRANDIESVGDTFHHTFFEMLGSWSIGDKNADDGIGKNGYWKKEAISWAYEFCTSDKYLDIPKEKLAFSVFKGDKDAPFDQESYDLLCELGIPKERIIKLPKKNNWWGQVLGPCGPNAEIFYWSGKENAPEIFDHDDSRWIEIWNIVFMEFDRKTKEADQDGNPIDYYFDKLAQKNIDTGMGFERVLALLNGTDDNYQTELFQPIIKTIEENIDGEVKYEDKKREFRIIADHIRAAVFLLADGVVPGNVGQGYILRRLIRRIIRYWRLLGGEGPILNELASSVIETYKNQYLRLSEKDNQIISELQKEEKKFAKALSQGLKEFKKMTADNQLSGRESFRLYESYGFPFEMTKELAKEKNIKINEDEFKKALSDHQEKSRTATAGMFKSGLAGESEVIIKYHSASHLLLAALRKVLGNHVVQKGSNITEKRLRLDFSHPEKLTDEERQKVEDLVNEQIKADLPIKMEEMNLEDAKKSGAMGVFEKRYGTDVKVYSMGNFSKEICAGPHVEHTGILGHFKITNELSSSAGVRRIKAVLE